MQEYSMGAFSRAPTAAMAAPAAVVLVERILQGS
jgi:hypothetical protein